MLLYMVYYYTEKVVLIRKNNRIKKLKVDKGYGELREIS